MDLNCKRCLVRESADEQLSVQIAKTILRIPLQERTQESVYESRLDICRNCSSLLAGICQKCGCFVEVRAAKATECCPDIPDRWKELPG